MKKLCYIFLIFILTFQASANSKFFSQESKHKATLGKNEIRKLLNHNFKTIQQSRIYKASSQNSYLDKSFGTNGVVDTNLAQVVAASSRDIANSLALQADGKLVAGGISTAIDNFVNFSLARYTTTGILDNSFGTKGVVTTDVGALLGAGSDTSYSFIDGIAIQTDGKIVAAGSVNNPINFLFNFALVRYKTDGSVDSTFGNNGAVITDVGAIVGTPNKVSQIFYITLQADGKILAYGISGTNVALARYNTDGTLDNSFGTNGIVINSKLTPVPFMRIVLQSNGEIITGGNIDSKIGLVKYKTDGTIDNSFGNNGMVITSFGPNFQTNISDIGIYNDKIIAAGISVNGTNVYYSLAKYNNDGSPDNSFGTNGLVNKTLTAAQVVIFKIAIQNDGKIVTGGTSFPPNNPKLFESTFVITRTNIDGTIDSSFGNNGVVTTNFGLIINSFPSVDRLYSLIIEPNGKIISSGSSTCIDPNYDYAIVRYNINGSIDNTFGEIDGQKLGLIDTDFKKVLGITSGSENSINGIATQSNGNIVTGGFSDALDPNYDFAISLYDINGNLKQFFPVDFSRFVGANNKIFGSYDIGNDLAIQKNDKIVAVGLTNVIGNPFSFALARLTPDARLDISFGNQGLVVTNIGNTLSVGLSSDIINSVVIQNDAKILVGGSNQYSEKESWFAFARYNSDGTLDNNFGGGNGINIVNVGNRINKKLSFDSINSIALQQDGKIIGGGFSTAKNPLGDFTLMRLKADGTTDKSFGDQGIVITNFDPSKTNQSQINKIAIQKDGKILAGGISSVKASNFNPNNPQFNFALVRYNNDGSIDKSFGNNGFVVTQITPKSNDYLSTLVIQTNGTIIAGGASNASDPNYDFTLEIYDANGKLDSTIGNNGVVFTDFKTVLGLGAGSQDSINTNGMTIQADGRVLAAGSTNATNPNFDFAIAKYKIQTSTTFTGDTFLQALCKKYGK
ncbi:MAG: hypothetical protein P4L22_06730 [Candidatus Babeliales bacterium]|nr:hypothetical protein [Candidatus Babeliales bacterium]